MNESYEPTQEELMTMLAEDLATINERNTNADFYCSRLQKMTCDIANYLRKNNTDMAELEKAIDEFEYRLNQVIA